MKNFGIPAFFSAGRLCCVIFFLLLSFPALADVPNRAPPEPQNIVPPLLAGLWDGDDRYIYFPENQDEKRSADIAIILKTLYGWYYDRAAEPASYADTAKRTVNSVTAPEPEKPKVRYAPIPVTYRTLVQQPDSGVWEIVIHYSRNVDVAVPVAVIGNRLYLDFVYRPDVSIGDTGSDGSVISSVAVSAALPSGVNAMDGFWQGVGEASGIKVCPPVISGNLTSLYIAGNSVYRIRYWKTDMKYGGDTVVTFSDQAAVYSVTGHVFSAGSSYTCVTGLSRFIRNVGKNLYPLTGYTVDSSYSICAFGTPYLTRTDASADVSSVMQLVAKANSRRKPNPPPLFPPDDLNWHLDEISQLDIDDPLIQAVRLRQKDFLLHHADNQQ